MRGLHYVNAVLWLANALVWALYAHVFLMSALSVGAAALAVWLGKHSDNWRYR